MRKLLIVDDEKSIRVAVEHVAAQNGFEVCQAGTGEEAIAVYERERPDIVVLDIMLPGIDGFEVCKDLRERGFDVPIIFLSAKGDIVDKRVGFEAGGDDYVVKPFSPVELMLRIEAVLRRSLRSSGTVQGQQFKVGDISIDVERHEAFKGDDLLDLTHREFELLAFLAKNVGKVFTREQLLETVCNETFPGYANTITVLVRRVREKIEDDPSKPRHLQTVWGVGYKLVG